MRKPASASFLPEAQAGNAGLRRGVGRPRHPVTVEIVGSNPIEDASRNRDRARYANRQSGEAQTFVVCGFDSHSCHLWEGEAPAEPLSFRLGEIAAQQELRPPGIAHMKYASAGHWRA
jgi:hypothetical protein